MQNEVLVALLALVGTLVGSGSGVLISNRLVNYRLDQLEKKVDKHNQILERIAVAERDIKTAFRLIDETRKGA